MIYECYIRLRRGTQLYHSKVLLRKINLARGLLHGLLIDVKAEAGKRAEEKVFLRGPAHDVESEDPADEKKRRLGLTNAFPLTTKLKEV